ncbi:unnamed protein product [Cladocopium goreaui]|uniref:28S rRNA (Cytosine-C(5))-methyltransferase (NOL1-related protein) (NOL1R) (NOL1/NOP2/Sun domain family member 5) (Williams-Beuren syndrome chromosomal region 20A protein) n=1 Tax=Cladocopium goreaui TaxID=2562237 RepID=A0A9P1FG71_9DINO|nr:unnamed protein product [Cladocopium goreaui]
MAKLYREAGRVVDDVVSGRCGLKAALYAQDLEKPRAVCKLASAALSNQRALSSALRQARLEETGIFLVMAFELLVGSGKIRGGGQLRRRMEKKLKILKKGFNDAGGAEQPSAFAQLPRYVRINSLRWSEVGVEAQPLQHLSKALKDAYQKDLAAGRQVAAETAEVSKDELVPELLVLHPAARCWLQQLPEVQDRSSCLSALAAGLTHGTIVLDACAAPGSKTSHAIELLGGSGKMFAFEKDPRRGKALLQRLRLLCGFEETRRPRGAKGKKASVKRGRCLAVAGHPGVEVEVRIKDFLEVKPWEPPWNQVEVLLVDPSCSGSGLPEHQLQAETDAATATAAGARLKRLAAFQRRILQHAMKFPKARTVVYSTCSLHRLENEDVVTAALSASGAFQVTSAVPWWRNAPRNAEEGAGAEPLPSWAHLCLRSEPGFHRCRGFFLCRLDRVDGGATAEEQLTQRKRRKRKLAELKKSQRATEDRFQAPASKKRKGKAASGLRISVAEKTPGLQIWADW